MAPTTRGATRGWRWGTEHSTGLQCLHNTMTYTVAIYLFKNVEVLDFAGPFEVFTTASRVALRRQPDAPAPFKVFTVAGSTEPVRARAGLLTLPDH